MAGIARNIELYNSAYGIAWTHISELQKREQPELARHLHDSIRRQLEHGATEPLFIASDALKALDERSERPSNALVDLMAASSSRVPGSSWRLVPGHHLRLASFIERFTCTGRPLF